MSEERAYPLDVIRELLNKQQQDVAKVEGVEWLARVVEVLKNEAAAVPLPEDEADTIPEYIYPH